MEELTWTFAQDFVVTFQTTSAELTTRLESLRSFGSVTPDDLQKASQDVSKLSKELTDATGRLPSYDQRQCVLQLQTLERKVNDLQLSTNKPKFSFKRKAVQGAPTPVADTEAQNVHKQPTSDKASSVLAPAPSDVMSIRSLSHRYLDTSFWFPSENRSELSISTIENCIVNLLPRADQELSLSAVHVAHLSDSILLLPQIKGSMLLHNIKNCVIVASCHQFRMHDSLAVDVYLNISSNPIIETSNNIRFAPYPDTLRELLPHNNLQLLAGNCQHLAVQDFSHIRTTPSPHWHALPEGLRVADWSNAVRDVGQVDSVLARLLPDKAS